jgi:hypothetical protein
MTSTITRKVTTEVVVTSNVAILDGTNVEELIATLKESRKAIAVLKEQEQEAKKAILELLGEAETGTINGADRVKVKTITRTDIDRDILKKDYSEAWLACSYQNEYVKLITE